MNVKIRSERVTDYCSIANVNYEAFLGWHPDNQYVSEPIIVDLLRHNSGFGQELSLVAEIGDKVVGHVLFSPYRFMVMGNELKGVVLAPIAVKPEFQKAGIGGLLIEEGHRRAKELGYEFSLLCGHVDYYPRYGYKNSMFAVSGSRVTVDMEAFRVEGFSVRPVNEKDIPWLADVWEKQHKEDSIALFPGRNICEWCNHTLQCRSLVITKNGRELGYARYVRTGELCVKELVAEDVNVPDMLAYLAWSRYGLAKGELQVTLPAGKLAAVLDPVSFSVADEQTAHRAFMIKVLCDNSRIAQYCDEVAGGKIKPGIIVFPAAFDVDDGRTE